MPSFWITFILSLVPDILLGLKADGKALPLPLVTILKAIDAALDAVLGDPPAAS